MSTSGDAIFGKLSDCCM